LKKRVNPTDQPLAGAPGAPVDPDDDTRGIVDPGAGLQRFRLTRHVPRVAPGWAVDRIWTVRWDLRPGEAYDQRIVPHPAVHLVFDDTGHADVQAISPDEFVRHLTGRGQVIGVKFRPAGFRPYLGAPVSSIAGQRRPAATVFGPPVLELADRLRRFDDLDGAVPLVDRFVASLGAAPLPMTEPVNALVDHLATDPTITRVDELARRLETNPRRLQRLFAEHVGLGPKWVINRLRVHEAAERATRERRLDWAGLAAELGYSDQSHLVREFASAVGEPPDRYARRLARTARS
jgi:AraC-like DNA-binding protein